ncbi:MAG: 3-hydroxybutyryl-CoA dehydrogenase [Gemmatimonadetes bacterium]|nr:3-hydroxybutyryl-CoA dehydrogenase [Gemmatimonadota bacterium]
MRTVGVVGAGTMGNGIAHVFAQSGREVRLVDADPAALTRARDTIARNLERQARRGALARPAEEVLARIDSRGELEALAGVDLVVEAIVEDPAAKLRLFRELDGLVGGGILASNTSAISITRLGAATRRPARVVGMHFMNPVPVMPLVEVVSGLDTSADVTERIVALCRELGKSPVVVRDSPGFVSNRVLMPMINEAVFCLAEGVADAPAIDEVLQLGMRHPLGPLALADLIGLDVCLAILEVLHAELGEDKYRPCPLLRRMVAAGHLGRKSGRGFHAYPEAGA